jgi:carbon storage regulator
LVLTRRPGERIVIADNIVVTVLQVKGGNIRLGVEAPADVHVVRKELTQRAELAPITAGKARV